MVTTLADTRREDRIYAAMGAILFVLLLFLLLLFYVFTTPNPPYPEVGGGGGGGGIELSFGDAAYGMGNTNPDQLSGDPKPVEEVQPDVLTQEVEDAATLPPRINKPTAPVKPVEKPKVNTKAMFTKKGGSQGSSNKAGNEGDPKGDPNSLFKGGGGKGPGEGGGEGGGKGNGKGPGEGDGEGPGKGNGKNGGISYSMKDRTPKSLPKPDYPSNVQGKVVVDIGIDEKGNVVSAKIGRGTTVTDKKLQDQALAAAKRAKFSIKADAPEQQFGSITYSFIKE